MKLDLVKFQKSRESRVEAGGHVFILRRPTALDVVRLSVAGDNLTIENAVKYVVGWEQVNELDLLPGGVPEPIDFDPALCAAWVADRPDFWMPIVQGVIDAYQRHEAEMEQRGNV